MQLYTPVPVEPSSLRISHGTPLLTLGSCFADNIGQKLSDAGHNILCNPFGTLYNPLSIALALDHALADREIDSTWLVHNQGLWHSWLHHTRFSHPDADTCLQGCNQSIHQTHRWLLQHPIILITFGTAFVYQLATGPYRGRTVANCHKLPPQHFTRTPLSITQIVDTWQPLLNRLCKLNCTLIFTVSPIRHLADGLHQNQLSKSTLLLAVDTLLQQTPSAQYFPAYEILLDQLRDYRFYARDMCHPSDLAVDIIWQQWQDTFMSPSTQQQNIINTKHHLHAQHRPIAN